jgi:hypothetical protein
MVMELTVFLNKWQETVNIMGMLKCGKVQEMDLVSAGEFILCVSWL